MLYVHSRVWWTMALVTKVVLVRKDNRKVHRPTTCECSVFEDEGQRYVQLDTFGTDGRQFRGKISQSLQLDAQGAQELRAILDEAFPSKRH